MQHLLNTPRPSSPGLPLRRCMQSTCVAHKPITSRHYHRHHRFFSALPAAATDQTLNNNEDDDEDDDEDFYEEGTPLSTRQSSQQASLPDDDAESRGLAVALAKVCWETKGEDVVCLHVSPLVYWTRYMVIATVFSRPQLNAMLAKVEAAALEQFDRRPAASAAGNSAWELLDYGDVVLHVMTADQREYYDLESFYGAAEEVDLPFVGVGLSTGTTSLPSTSTWDTNKQY